MKYHHNYHFPLQFIGSFQLSDIFPTPLPPSFYHVAPPEALIVCLLHVVIIYLVWVATLGQT